MIYLETTAREIVDKYPSLEEGLPVCNCAMPSLRVFKTPRSVGIQCTECNSGTWTRYVDSKAMVDLLYNIKEQLND